MPCGYSSLWDGMYFHLAISDSYLLSLLQHVPACLSQGMDIADIELVVVYGTPDTPSQFYQVHVYSFPPIAEVPPI